jgi:hypothetical protein
VFSRNRIERRKGKTGEIQKVGKQKKVGKERPGMNDKKEVRRWLSRV